jgi:hypothetical protein
MAATNYFEILRRGQRANISLILPQAAAPRGAVFQESATAGAAELADGTKRGLFVCKPVLTDFPALTIAETTGEGSQPLGLEYVAADAVTLGDFEDADEILFGGPDYRYSGTGAITAATALKTKVGFKDGKFRTPQSTEYAEFMLVEKPIIDGLQCYRIERVEGFPV